LRGLRQTEEDKAAAESVGKDEVGRGRGDICGDAEDGLAGCQAGSW